jgi:hypothetical protein
MSAAQRVGDLGGVSQRLVERGPLFQHTVERTSFDESHDHEIDARICRDVVNGDDVGMVERGRGLRLLHEAALAFRIRDALRRQNFDGDVAVQVGVEGLVDHAHPSRAHLLQDLVVQQPASRQLHGSVILLRSGVAVRACLSSGLA